MGIARLNEWDLTPQLEAEIAGLLRDGFGNNFGGRSYFQQRHHIRFTARKNGANQGHMALGYRNVRLDGR